MTPLTMTVVVPPGRSLPERVEGVLVDELGVLPVLRSYKHGEHLGEAIVFVVFVKPFSDHLMERLGGRAGG
jgi:hypothetical protein